MKRLILGIMILMFGVAAAAAAEEVVLSLDEAVAIALRDNATLHLRAEDVRKAKKKIEEARAAFYPSLTFSGSWTDTMGYYAKDSSSIGTQLSAKQYLYKGGRTVHTVSYNEYLSGIAQAIELKGRLDTIYNVRKSFYAALLARDLVRLNDTILKNTREHLNFLNERYKAGQASQTDVMKVEASLANVREAYEAARHQEESARALLRNILAIDEGVGLRLEGGLAYSERAVLYDEMLLAALKKRPEIRQLETQVLASRKAVEITKADNRPSIYASWDYYSKSTTLTAAGTPSRAWEDHSIAGITFTWPFFDGWMTKAKVEQALIDVKEAEILKEQTVRDVALELKTAYLSLKDAIEKVKAADADIEVYEDHLKSVEARLKEGIASTLDLDDAKLQREVAMFNRTLAVYDHVTASIFLDRARGELS